MTGLLFLAGALGLSVLGSLVLWLRHRKPTSLESGITAFDREMSALAPNDGATGRRDVGRGPRRSNR